MEVEVRFDRPAQSAPSERILQIILEGTYMLAHPTTQHIELWPIERLVEYPRNPRKHDAAATHPWLNHAACSLSP